MQNSVLVFTPAEIILTAGGFIIIFCSLGVVLFELSRKRRERDSVQIQQAHHVTMTLRIGLSISSILVALDMLIGSFIMYCRIPSNIIIIAVFITIIMIVFISIISTFLAFKE